MQVGLGIATCQLYHKAALQEKMKTHSLGMEFACSALFDKEQQKRPFKRMVKIEGTNRNRNENDHQEKFDRSGLQRMSSLRISALRM